MRKLTSANILILLLISCLSCSKKNTDAINSQSTDLPFIIDCKTLSHEVGNGLDSQVGTLTCDNFTFNYDYGRFSYAGPNTLQETFTKSFYSVYYSAFFDAVYLEEKLKESFKDSVKIVETFPELLGEKMIIPCNNCNATAKLKFKDSEFYYPFVTTMNSDTPDGYQLAETSSISNNKYKKIYTSTHPEKLSGIYIGYNNNPRKTSNLNKLSVTTEDLPSKELIEILRSIKMK